MSTIPVYLSEQMWQDLISLAQREQISPNELIQQAIHRFLLEKRHPYPSPPGLWESFGLWEDRKDLTKP